MHYSEKKAVFITMPNIYGYDNPLYVKAIIEMDLFHRDNYRPLATAVNIPKDRTHSLF